MKKTLKVFAIVACALGMLFTSCSQPQTPSNIEVVTVDATEITVKALPGKNKVTWTPVSNAEYVLYVNGENRALNTNKETNYDDTNVVDGKEYTYTVYTIPAGLKVESEFDEDKITTIGGNKVAYYTKGNKSSATVKAIVPPFVKDGKLVTALDVIDYDPEAKAEDKVTAENINFFYDEDENSVKFSFPVKNYLGYTYKLYKGNELEVFGKKADPFISGNTLSGNTSSKNFGTTATLTAAGEYTLVVEVTCDNYKTSKITAAKKVTVDPLDAPVATSAQKAYYIDEGTKARIIWTPAKKADESYWAPKNYTVYVKDIKNVYTPINLVKSTTVGEDGAEITKEEIKTLEGTQKGDKVYYVEYDVTNNKVDYTFYVVLNDNGKLEADKKEAKLNAYAEIANVVFNGTANVDWTATDNTAKKDDAVLTITGLSDDQEIEFVKYKVLSKKANETYTLRQALLDSEFVDAKVPEKYTKNDIIVKDIAEDSKVVFLYAIKEKGKKSFYEFKELSWEDLSDSTNAILKFTAEERTDYKKDPTYLVSFSSTKYDEANNWKYEVYYAKLDSNSATLDGVSNWTSVGAITPTLNESKTAWEAKVKGITLAATTEKRDELTNKLVGYYDTYAIKFVKTNPVINYTKTNYTTVDVKKTVEE